MRKSIVNHIEIVGTAFILLVGTAFSILPPASPGVSWDDETHYTSTLLLSHVFDRKMSLADERLLSEFANVALQRRYYPRKNQRDYYNFLDAVSQRGYYLDVPESSIGYETISYIPSAAGLIIARGLSLPYHMEFIIGKWMNVLLFSILCFFSMKLLKSGRMIVLLIALIPTNIFWQGIIHMIYGLQAGQC